MAAFSFPLPAALSSCNHVSRLGPFTTVLKPCPRYLRICRRVGLAHACGDGDSSSPPFSFQSDRVLAESSSSSSEERDTSSSLTFQQAIQKLQEYWASVGCAVMQCSNTEVGAGTMNPLTFLRVLGPEPWNVAYVEPSIRPDDSRYGENPNRLQRHTQFQVILKPDPGNSQDLFLHSLSALGIDVRQHDIRFVEDNWESPVLGAWGLGWEVWMDGMEITQFTYFQQAGSLQLMPVSVEITYGLERIIMLLQGVNHFKEINYTHNITYGELYFQNEKEMSTYYLEHANVDYIQRLFNDFEQEARSLVSLGLPIPAYDQLLKASHAFNILDSRGFVGVTERARYFARMRSLARRCAELWVKTRESLGYPLGVVSSSSILVHPTVPDVNLQKVVEEPCLFVVEIGTEEMPPNDVVDASEQLKILTVEALEKRRLHYEEVLSYCSPRRIVLCVKDLCAKQAEEEIEVRGPPAEKAFDQNGRLTKAAEGFCRKNNASTDSLYKRVEGKNEYVFLRVKELCRFAIEVLAEDLPDIISKLSFPKSMRWNSNIAFSRPIRWIFSMHGDSVVPFVFAGVPSGHQSYGLRHSSSANLKLESAESYLITMRNAGILIDSQERKRKIINDSISLAATINGDISASDDLVEEVSNLVEAPVSILGRFCPSFLELPKEVLMTVMQKHQKYFPLTCKFSGNLLPFFIAITNGLVNENVVRKGNEAVLRARYEDAKFFYKKDTEKKFSDFRDQLKGILFHEKLGTMLDKVSRLQKTVDELALALNIEQSFMNVIRESVVLAMSDLSTSMVTEFTSLAGIMARHYSLRDGHSEQVAEALYEITLPRFSGDILPRTAPGIVLAVADRLDSIVGLFGAGCQPTSNSDPFGLKRKSYGLVQILVENKKNLDLRGALTLFAGIQPIDITEDIINDVFLFITRRLEQVLVDKGINSEIVRSVLVERAHCPYLASQTADDLEAFSRTEDFSKVIEVYARPTRITRGKYMDPNFTVEPEAFETTEEQVLWSTYQEVSTKINPGVEVRSFAEASLLLQQPLQNFFNNVYVMTEDQRIRNNRLALLRKIADLPRGIADLTLLPGF